jgi:hypothetical protein
MSHALLPGGIFAGQLFGILDSWADDPNTNSRWTSVFTTYR